MNVVNAGLADFARVALTYTIGREEVGLNITTNGTAHMPQDKIHTWVRDRISLTINHAQELFRLRDPQLYREIAARSDYFNCPTYPWNRPLS